ncbi:DUF2225 domain-containing protein [Paenibacillus sp. MER TA 81-3]|uniref:DUF2225 domain-containing protein n=1 Tax=Paenibacillus sp. MER TA 81-3 TaxID=2939573 RepID=UPI00203B2181|nr:DUF2225 domain-containing protein [Paenibacillus sp. MER TA 81-3]MCM3338882.1 DUF2225 domain-containing protein [Paenibacillus sp. MER TA 81-3]
MEVEPLYLLQVECPYCKNTFQSSRVRSRFKKPIHIDSDFCPHFGEDKVNPDFYVVRVCPECGCASTENSLKQWLPTHRKDFEEVVASQWKSREYAGERTWEQALETYKLALLTAQTIGESKRVVAGLLHHIAWLYRYRNDTKNELRYLRFALDSYISVFEHEWRDQNDARLIYIIGELYRRLGELNEAAKCFGRIIHDKHIMDAAMIRAAREQWAAIREQMAEEGNTPPVVSIGGGFTQ